MQEPVNRGKELVSSMQESVSKRKEVMRSMQKTDKVVQYTPLPVPSNQQEYYPERPSTNKGYKYEVLVYNKLDVRRSNLSCFHCFNGDNSDCIGMSDIQKIPIQNCLVKESFCKVRRFSIDGRLTTFDRNCAEKCIPGCQEGGLYSECVSCCNHRSFCNVGNLAKKLYSFPALLKIFLSTVIIYGVEILRSYG
ncbi:hypothetical protein RRG08_015491 [Elysia crispata]|uniref:Snake toxin/toxin-like domain-containing protein n=1 Tax=Elysia crispata TaxID=231223 RepID=A0AAE1AEL3_9GAST|nr:hypothetical protein RRG08_015491 [Elysia crispata]